MTASERDTTVGFIGLGMMGVHMATNIVSKGHPLVVYDIAPEKSQRLAEAGVPKALAQRIASLDVLAAGGDVVRIARDSGVPVLDTGHVYFELGARLGIDWVRHASRTITPESEWEKLAIDAIVDDSYRHQSALTNRVLDVAGGGKLGPKVVEDVIETWVESRNGAVERTCQMLDDLRSNATVDLAMLSVANGQLRNLLAG